MTQLIDRRKNAGKKSTVNRQRFLRRYKDQIKRAVSDAISKRSITDINKGEQISIPSKDISEPRFQAGPGGSREQILPGNNEYVSGDRVQRSPSGGANGSGDGDPSNTGEGEDNFVFELSRDEFLELFFDDLELPDLVKKELARITTYKTIRAGITNSGIPSNINVRRSMRQATGRRIAIGSPHKKRLKLLEEELALLKRSDNHNCASTPPMPTSRGLSAGSSDVGRALDPADKPREVGGEGEVTNDLAHISRLEQEIEALKRKIQAVPFIDTIDLRYNHRVRVHSPSTQAVMFCVMDVSGSMDEVKKDIAKRFFILLYLFLTKNYQKIELVFIRHHTSAKEVSENDFFYSRETGGTVVSSALELLHQIIESRYPPAAWNIYVAQASDGDNWNADSPYCLDLLNEKIMPLLQYFAYIEIMPRHHQSLWEVYEQVQQNYHNFAMENIDSVVDIYPVFRELFKRKTV